MRKIAILGATGSIGTQTVDVLPTLDAQVTALTTNKRIELLEEQARKLRPKMVCAYNEQAARDLKIKLADTDIQVVTGMDGLRACAAESGADIVVTAVVGMVGLLPTLDAIQAGKDIALANKETLVCAGNLVIQAARQKGVKILPVDSEHSAIFQCLHGEQRGAVETIFLTASGGPFRKATEAELQQVTVEQALAHPNWSMGHKITTDSATMINKGLEIIEAKWLFDVEPENIHVLIQPQSIIHSMVGFEDGAVMAQLGTPDMRLPIQYALYYPKRLPLAGERLDFEQIAEIHFEKPNTELLRGIPLALEACAVGGSMPTVMNAANEYAVAKFLQKDIGFLQIYDMIELAMKKHHTIKNPDLTQILETERETYELLDKEWRKG